LRKNANWPADRVERWPLAKLVPDARNARTHSDEQVAQLAASIEEWGWTIPVLGRVMAAHRLGIGDVPVMVAAGWTDAKKRAYMLADNKLTLNAEWDLDRLAIEISELRASDFDISLIGFSESEIDELLKAGARGDIARDVVTEKYILGMRILMLGPENLPKIVDKSTIVAGQDVE
jgi:ParB-like chromosome segregation protein Spo0J